MFHQVEVLGKQRSFLTIYGKIVYYQVCAHLFEIISFPSSNYYESNKAIYKAIYNSNGYWTKFNLAKFISKNKSTLISIWENKKKEKTHKKLTW